MENLTISSKTLYDLVKKSVWLGKYHAEHSTITQLADIVFAELMQNLEP